MTDIKNIILLLCLLLTGAVSGQQRLGIGTSHPDRTLDVETYSPVTARIHATGGGVAGLLLTRGGISTSRDFHLVNSSGNFSMRASDDNFTTIDELLKMTSAGNIGIGTSAPISKLHVVGTEDASNSTDGYMVVGSVSGKNLVFDPNEIIARNNGAADQLVFQPDGGDVYLQSSGGNSYFAPGSGYVVAGNANGYAKFNIGANGFQLKLSTQFGSNDWFIGASESTWQTGDSLLIFSPENNSNSAVFRLSMVTDNNGSKAPVMIQSATNQALLMDGNEIDSKYGPLHINYNSGEDTYLNRSGGYVGIGTTNPGGNLHVVAIPGTFTTTLQHGPDSWNIHPYPNTNNLGFRHNNSLVAHVDDASGAWVALSDQRYKTQIRDAEHMLKKVSQLRMKSYEHTYTDNHDMHLGFLAQDVQKIFPELVHEDDDGGLTMAYAQFSVVAIKALQDQEQEIERLEAEVESLLAQVAETPAIPEPTQGVIHSNK